MTEAMPFLQKYDITFLRPLPIAGGVPLASAGAPAASLLTAFFLFLLPLWQLVTAGRGRRATV